MWSYPSTSLGLLAFRFSTEYSVDYESFLLVEEDDLRQMFPKALFGVMLRVRSLLCRLKVR